jgi:hypothetical protein
VNDESCYTIAFFLFRDALALLERIDGIIKGRKGRRVCSIQVAVHQNQI